MLELKQLRIGYKNSAIAGIPTLSLPSGEHCLMLGPSGSGKTTLLCTIAGLLAPVSGEIVINDRPLTAMSNREADTFRSRHVGFIFQTLHMVPSLTILDNLLLVRFASGLPQDRSHAVELLDRLGLGDRINDKPATLSQGQQQRAAIARAIINGPGLLLGDEPTSALDDGSCESVMKLLLETASTTGASLVIATHDQRIKPFFANQVVLGGAA